MLGFHEVRFPEDVSWGSSGGPTFKTQVYESVNGYEKRNVDWSQPLMVFDVKYGIKTDVQMLSVFEFFNARQGRAYGFRYKNWGNYRITAAPIATGDGFSTRLPIWKFYGFQGSRTYKRLYKIVEGSVSGVGISAPGTMVEGVDYNIDYNAGEIALNYAPGYGVPVYAQTLEFDEPVRFDLDSLQAAIDGFNNNSLTSLKLIGVKGVFKTGSIFAPNQDSQGSDLFFENVRLILNFDDIDNLSTTIDQSELANPVTLNNDATLVTTGFAHGEGAFSPGITGYASLSGIPYSLSNMPFTLETFLRVPGAGPSVQYIIGKWDDPGNAKCWALRFLQQTQQLQFVISPDGISEEIVLNFPWTTGQTDQFDYISIDRLSSGTYVLRINGTVMQTVKSSSPIADFATTPLTVGGLVSPAANEGSYQALIDSMRLTVGRARHRDFDQIDIPSAYPS